MRSILPPIVFVSVLSCGLAEAQVDRSARGLEDVIPFTFLVDASPEAGFHYPYFLKLPTLQTTTRPVRLLVEANNSGATSDDFNIHFKAAHRQTEQGVGAFVANRLEIPFLVPVFPRPGADNLIYTHALDRDSLDIRSGPMRRLDLQLVAMIDDATRRLRAGGMQLDDRVLMIGFSASGTFANRFSMIHPRRVAAVAIGGFNAILMLPVEEIDDVQLPYPLGLSDFEERFGQPFDRKKWLAIPQFTFMGENDINDAVQFDDAYSDEDRRKIYQVIGEPMPARWRAIQQMYKSAGANLRSSTYPGIGHGTNGAINTDMADFLATHAISRISDAHRSATQILVLRDLMLQLHGLGTPPNKSLERTRDE
jgi:pimeloyl-ACP methyl ester carboxylesterase